VKCQGLSHAESGIFSGSAGIFTALQEKPSLLIYEQETAGLA
jgi:hypothetical protein